MLEINAFQYFSKLLICEYSHFIDMAKNKSINNNNLLSLSS